MISMEDAKRVGGRNGLGPLWVLLLGFLVGVGALAGLILGWHDRTAETVGRIVWEETGVRPAVVRKGVRSFVSERAAPKDAVARRMEGVNVLRSTIYLTDHRVMVKVSVDGDEARVSALMGVIQERVRTIGVVEVSRE